MTGKHPKRPRDLNQWAKRMVDIATGEAEDDRPAESSDAQKIRKRTRPQRWQGAGQKALAHYPLPPTTACPQTFPTSTSPLSATSEPRSPAGLSPSSGKSPGTRPSWQTLTA